MTTDGWLECSSIISFISRSYSARAARAAAHLLEHGPGHPHHGRLLRGRETQDESETHAVAAEWRDRLHTLLRADPSARAELLSLLDSLAEPPRNQASPAVHNAISGGVQHGPVIQTGRIDGSVLSTPHND
ncbi:hypothetical protein [Streptomyces sp. NPDC088246]|uniref:hypothetical protein n=1 Tax=Streptomyces sp. NPDC088246 TaxID=3365842 RepID=UPI00382372BE